VELADDGKWTRQTLAAGRKGVAANAEPSPRSHDE